MNSPIVYGLEFKTAKEFGSLAEANEFLSKNIEYGCLAQEPEFSDNPTKVWVAKLNDRGSVPEKKQPTLATVKIDDHLKWTNGVGIECSGKVFRDDEGELQMLVDGSGIKFLLSELFNNTSPTYFK